MVLNGSTLGYNDQDFSFTNSHQVPLSPEMMLADLKSMSALCLSELRFRCRAEATDSLPNHGEAQLKHQYAHIPPPPISRECTFLA